MAGRKKIVVSPIFKLSFKIIKPKFTHNPDFIELTHTEDGHGKYYAISLSRLKRSGYDVTIIYGKIGTNYQSKNHNFSTEEMAYSFMRKKRDEKIKKGYKIVNNV